MSNIILTILPLRFNVMIVLIVPCSLLFIDCFGYDCDAIIFISFEIIVKNSLSFLFLMVGFFLLDIVGGIAG